MFRKIVLASSVLAILLVTAMSASAAYSGPEACKPCHTEKYDLWKNTLHAKAVINASDALAAGYPVPEGVNKDDLKFTWPGKWKVRWVNKSGYVITGAAAQYNTVEKRFVPYEAGQTQGYDCGRCHTTGYDNKGTMFQGPNAFQSGTWKIQGVTCERCHGEGSEHVKSPSKSNIKVDRTPELCSDCHGRTDPAINLKKTDLDPRRRHRVQYNDFYQSKKFTSGQSCNDCHDSHETTDALYFDLGKKYDMDALSNMKPARTEYYKGTDNNVKTEDYEDTDDICGECHAKMSSRYPGAPKVSLQHGGIKCIDCHMAKSRRNAMEWDERSHTYMIDDRFNYSMARPYMNYPDLTCKPCHKDMDFTKVTLSAGLHSVAKPAATTPAATTAAPTATATPKTPGFEALFAVAAVLIAVLLVRRR